MLIRGLVGAAIGILGGAGAGALTFGWDASMFVGSSFLLGSSRDWWPLAAWVGALSGAALGLALGLYISLAGVGAPRSAIAGGVAGAIGAVVMLSTGEGCGYWRTRSVPSRVAPLMLSLIIWALLGLLLRAAASKLSNPGRG